LSGSLVRRATTRGSSPAARPPTPPTRALDRQYQRPSETEGRFGVFGELASGRAFVEASAEGYGKGVRQACEVGATGLELVLRKSGTMAGSVQLPAVGKATFTLGIHPEEPERMAGFSVPSEFGARSTTTEAGITWGLASLPASRSKEHLADFRWLDLAPGSYTVALWGRGIEGQPRRVTLQTWRGVAVVSGEETRDPEMQQVDAEALIQALDAGSEDKR